MLLLSTWLYIYKYGLGRVQVELPSSRAASLWTAWKRISWVLTLSSFSIISYIISKQFFPCRYVHASSSATMIKFLPLDLYHKELYERMKIPFTVCKYLHYFQRYLSLKMCKICKWDDWWCHALNPISHHVYKKSYLRQFSAQTIETW